MNKKHYPPEGFAERITRIFYDSGKTHVELGKLLGVDRRTIYQYEKGTIAPNITVLAKICKEFDVAADYLLFGERWSS